MDPLDAEIFMLVGQIGQSARTHLTAYYARNNRRSYVITTTDKDTTRFYECIQEFVRINDGKTFGRPNIRVRFSLSDRVTLYGQREFTINWSVDGIADVTAKPSVMALRPSTTRTDAPAAAVVVGRGNPNPIVKVLLYFLFLFIGCMLLFIMDFMFHLRF